ncbi:PilW family protein [Xylella fastidiosa]|uniref:PilW family protein n=2 Tax=Xylella fastidiosa TaxID=2371 RepID=UPI0003D2E134|nr:PilW family protein [Xylella fastidiosa]ALR03633.1 PilW family protein [Xylella fastidiosa]ARO68014.1 pilus assembly protein PilW [Xylella fastidiosa subsp. pauca]AVI20193.1 pilus assembly protein PilW [Xylella fastidiosa]AVI22188.1 pilus assembly protein PilW [Xylella fastidiosa]KIA59189.1 pilus assembly protein PilW [Xylella fastidiosa]
MTMYSSRLARLRIRGLSLMELLIALLIGSILIVGVIQVFLASWTAYRLSQGIARNQESGRFALDFLTRDIRMAGHTGCINDQALLSVDDGGHPNGGNIRSLFLNADDRNTNNVSNQPFPLRFDIAIEGFDASGTGRGSLLSLGAVPVVGSASDWNPVLPAELAALKPIKGSDVLVLRYLSAEENIVTDFNPTSSPTIIYTDESVQGSSKVATGGSGLYAIADCNGASVFQASTAPTMTSMNVSAGGLNKTALDFVGYYDRSLSFFPESLALFRAESIAYYIGLNERGIPSLYRARWASAPAAVALVTNVQELVEGVESLQFLYGEDSAVLGKTISSGYIDHTNPANIIGDVDNALRWRRIGTVQIGLLVRGAGQERANSLNPVVNPTVLSVHINPPSDGQYRAVYETTVALRNRLYGN